MNETARFFGGEEGRLFGILHSPSGAPRNEAFVFCHPLCEEKLWSHRVFVSFARQLADAGYPVLRFDYRGNGDSDEEFSDCSVVSLLADIASSVTELRRITGVPQVSLLGLRSGATLAALAAEADPGSTARLVLWAPVVDGARYMQELLRINLTSQMATHKAILHDREALVDQLRQGQTVNVDGYEMAYPLYAEMSAVKLADEPKRFRGPCLIAQVDRQTGRNDAELQRLAASYPSVTLVAVQEEPFWKEIARFYERAPNLGAATLEWAQ